MRHPVWGTGMLKRHQAKIWERACPVGAGVARGGVGAFMGPCLGDRYARSWGARDAHTPSDKVDAGGHKGPPLRNRRLASSVDAYWAPLAVALEGSSRQLNLDATLRDNDVSSS